MAELVSPLAARTITDVDRLLELFRVDFRPRHRHPRPGGVLVATLAAIALSLAADALLAHAAVALWPTLRGYAHFRFSDYAKLTVIGIVIAAVGWPICSRVTSAPRWLYGMAAVAVTLVLWLPDLYLLYQGQPARAVAVLMAMHLAIALITYTVMVTLAPVGRLRPARRVPAPSPS